MRLAMAEQQRKAAMEAAQKSLSEAEAAVAAKLPAWEAGLGKGQTGWKLLDAAEAASSKKTQKLEKQPDLSIVSLGAEGKQNYIITAPLDLPELTGLRLEALTDSRFPGKGPGLNTAGNFVVSEIEASVLPKEGAAQPVKFAEAGATYQQGSYEVQKAINGQTGGEPDGWAVYPDGVGKPQTAWFRCKDPVRIAEGSRIRIVIKQQYPDGQHLLGRFRLAVTGAAGPLNFGLPAPVLDVLSIAAPQRTPEQTKVLADFVRATDAAVMARQAALAEAGKPVPPDAALAAAKAKLAQTEAPLPVDPALAALRRDFELSRSQLENKRLTAAQDLTWALINNPAFLFNH